jgi:hypothetical protein
MVGVKYLSSPRGGAWQVASYNSLGLLTGESAFTVFSGGRGGSREKGTPWGAFESLKKLNECNALGRLSGTSRARIAQKHRQDAA